MRTRHHRVAMLIAAVALVAAAAGARADEHEAASTVTLTVAAVEYEGTKLWVPATVVVHKGDRVKINLINKIPSDPAQHGWAVDAFKVAKVVNRGEPTSAEFVADRAGIFPIYCQLHPAHVGGQLIVLGH